MPAARDASVFSRPKSDKSCARLSPSVVSLSIAKARYRFAGERTVFSSAESSVPVSFVKCRNAAG